MTKTNLQQFRELAQSNPALREKIKAVHADYVRSLVRLSTEAGIPCKPEDFIGKTGELDETDLDNVAGGWGGTSMYGYLPDRPKV